MYKQSKKNNKPVHHMLDPAIWKEFRFRSSDIVICSYSKSGTTWIQQIIAQLIFNGDENINVAAVSPWLDCRILDKDQRLRILEIQSHRRFIKSHLAADMLELSSQAKYIYIARDGRDVVFSLYNHHRNLKKDVIDAIDSVPWRSGAGIGYAPASVLRYFHDWLKKDGHPWWPYWKHILSWWKIKTRPNVMLTHFAHLKNNMQAVIRRIAAFLDIDIKKLKWNTILHHCSFNYMKEHASKCVPFSGDLWKGGAKTFMHRGTSGQWKDILPHEEIKLYKQTALEKLGTVCSHWLFTGIPAE